MSPAWRRVLLVSLVLPILMGSKAKDWREVAESDIAFAQQLAGEAIKFDAAFRKRLIEEKVSGCAPRPSRIRELDQDERRLLGLYCLNICLPWYDTWAEILSACDRIWVPKWCKAGNEDKAVEHIGLNGYFERLTVAIRESHAPLERNNIMQVMADRLNSDVLRHHPPVPLDGWVTDVLSAYLETATAEEVVEIAEPICGATFGHGDRVAREFVAYRDRPGAMTEDQVCAMKAMLSRKDRWSCGPYSGGAIRKTAEEKIAERRALEAAVLTPENLALLSRRVDAFYQLEKDGKCSEFYEYLALDFREGGYSHDDWVRTCEHSSKDFKLLSYRVNQARALGNRVKVYTLLDMERRRGPEKGQVWSREWEIYWIFEDGTWNQGLGVPTNSWNDKQASVVQLPSVAPGNFVETKADE